MSSEATAKVIQEILGDKYHMENEHWVYEENGVRVEVSGVCSETHDSHFNVYILLDGAEVGQSLGVPQNKLADEIAYLSKLINM
jgi:hypothetical protein